MNRCVSHLSLLLANILMHVISSQQQQQGPRSEGQVLDARERILLRKLSKADDEWDEEEEDDDKEGRGRFLSERAPNPQTAPSRPREDIPDSLEQVQLPESEINNHGPLNNNFRGRGGRGRGRGGRFFHRGNFRWVEPIDIL